MSDTPQGETVDSGKPKTDGSDVSTQQGNANEQAEALRKEKEKAEMRARQLENELAKIREAEEKAKEEQLKEQAKWKELAEQKDARLKELEQEKEKEAELKARQNAENEVFGEFSNDVVEIAKDAGISLTDESDEGKERLRSTLKKLSNKIGESDSPTPNNPGTKIPKARSKEELLVEHAKNPNPNLVNEAISQLTWVQMNKQS